MVVSKIRNKDGEGKQSMSQFPMKGIKAKYIKFASGPGNNAQWEIIIHKL
jgi:hypothetical protein